MMLRKSSWAIALALLLAMFGTAKAASDSSAPIVIDAAAAAHPFPHFWEQIFGSGRAILSLRDDYRRDLRDVKQVTDLSYVRFHAILHDEVGVYDEDASGHAVYNFSYVDQIYDGVRAQGVRPFVEISFMPKKLAARDVVQEFFYHPNDSPPKDYTKWDALMKAFAEHLIARYGLDEVSQWYFEVWNEPNIGFWAGDPKQETYWELYDHTAADLKAVSPRLRVGGPATAASAWVDAFLKHCADKHVPVDFASTHVYGNDSAKDVFGTNEQIPRDKMVCRAVKKVHEQIQASPFPKMPLIWSEFNASYMNEPAVTDALYMGPWMAQTIGDCDGLVDIMSYWTFSDVFEEQGVVKTPFYGGFGLIAAGSIPKPSFNAFKVLHRLGDQRLASDANVLVTRRTKDGAIVAAVWNLAAPGAAGSAETVHLQFAHLTGKHRLTIARVDRDHGDVLPTYEKMGSPTYPTPQQLVELRKAAVLPPDETRTLKGDQLTLEIPAHGLVVIEVK
jgi:xylan 1,4-beta-xylosidase